MFSFGCILYYCIYGGFHPFGDTLHCRIHNIKVNQMDISRATTNDEAYNLISRLLNSLSMFTVGLLLSSNPETARDLVQVPSILFQGSLLLSLISRATLGYTALHAGTVSIHPLVIAGWCGLTTTAFNLLPVGCLDGGRAVQGAFGKTALTVFGFATYTLLGLGLIGGPLSLPWGLYVLICQRNGEKACLNDVTEVGTWRQSAVVAAIFVVVLTLFPVWDELAEELGIGLVTTF